MGQQEQDRVAVVVWAWGGRGRGEGDGGGGGVTGTQILNHRQEAESEPGMKRGSETLKPSPNAILPSSRPQLLDLSK